MLNNNLVEYQIFGRSPALERLKKLLILFWRADFGAVVIVFKIESANLLKITANRVCSLFITKVALTSNQVSNYYLLSLTSVLSPAHLSKARVKKDAL